MAKKSDVFTITSPTHAMALVVYFVTAVQGVFFLTDIASARGVESILGGRSLLFIVWAYGFVIAGSLSFISAFTSQYFRRPSSILRIELIGVIGVGLVNLLYAISLQKQGFESDNYVIPGWEIFKGFTFVATTQLFTCAFIVGALFRTIQIGLDLWKLRARVAREVQNDISTGA